MTHGFVLSGLKGVQGQDGHEAFPERQEKGRRLNCHHNWKKGRPDGDPEEERKRYLRTCFRRDPNNGRAVLGANVIGVPK